MTTNKVVDAIYREMQVDGSVLNAEEVNAMLKRIHSAYNDVIADALKSMESGGVAYDVLNDVIDTLADIGNGTTLKDLHEAAGKLYVFRDIWEHDFIAKTTEKAGN
ncbi:MAG: hypothetical protein HGA87_00445 [Desulfobulbaceae bacterium]|nr:hypothetical protein [Desulfobulbaceae bacterium]